MYIQNRFAIAESNRKPVGFDRKFMFVAVNKIEPQLFDTIQLKYLSI